MWNYTHTNLNSLTKKFPNLNKQALLDNIVKLKTSYKKENFTQIRKIATDV